MIIRSNWKFEPHPFFRIGPAYPWIIAHRGGGGECPENTIPAFRHGAALGVDMLECDIHRMVDGRFAVIHDALLDRTTNHTGPVVAQSSETLRGIDAGSRWVKPGVLGIHPWRGQDVCVPILDDLLKQFPQMRFSIELKQNDPAIVAPLFKLIREHGAMDRIVAGSFEHRVVREVRRQGMGLATQCTRRELLCFLLAVRLRVHRMFRPSFNAISCPPKRGRLKLVDKAFLDAAHYHGIPVHVWTVNTEQQMRELITMGVDGIITDYPSMGLKVRLAMAGV